MTTRRWIRGAIHRVALAAVPVAAVIAGAACSPSTPSQERADPTDPSEVAGDPSGDVVLTERSVVTGGPSADVVVDLAGPSIAIDPRVFGTNLPAWLGPDRLASTRFIEDTIASGVSLLRMPGGSWSNAYNWSACEREDETECHWTWAASPTEFVDFLQATGLPGMWTVSVNETAQSAAAAVAFFNGGVGDERGIGVDRAGVDWGTVAEWARLRAAHGNPEPIGLRLWEVGNEVYGGRPDTGGDECADFGWEEVWTCDGAAYVTGSADHDGYLAIRTAMISVDPSIEVGAVGVAEVDAWSNWGTEVIAESGDALDFYVVHQYGFDGSADGEEVIRRPGQMWPSLLAGLSDQLGETPIAITEHNLVSFEAGDTDRSMTKAMNGLYLADTLGQFVANGVPIANHWNLANGTTSSGTDYGLLRVEDHRRLPTYEAFRLWGRAASVFVPAAVAGDLAELHVYPTRDEGGRLVIVVVNIGRAVVASVQVDGIGGNAVARIDGVTTDDLDADDFTHFELDDVVVEEGALTVEFPEWSIVVVEVIPDA